MPPAGDGDGQGDDGHGADPGHADPGHADPGYADPVTSADDAPHTMVLEFSYADERRASLVERSVSQEVGEIEGDRTTATVGRDAATVVIDVRADDLVALRAGLNTWCTLVEVAERSSAAL